MPVTEPVLEWDDVEEDALAALAARVAGVLAPGEVLVLRGEVGVGKTTFVRAAARELGVRERVTSPTYQFARSYGGRPADGREIIVNHLDLYRLEGIEAEDALDLDEYLGGEAVTFIEWAEPALELLEEPFSVVEISHKTPLTRRMLLAGPVAARIAREG